MRSGGWWFRYKMECGEQRKWRRKNDDSDIDSVAAPAKTRWLSSLRSNISLCACHRINTYDRFKHKIHALGLPL